MKITFIGTGSGLVSTNNFHASYLIEINKSSILFDCGDGISKAILESRIDFNSISHIIISHNHPDHVSGLPNLINQMHIGKRENDLSIIAYKGLIAPLKKILDITYVFPEKLKFNLHFLDIDFQKVYFVDKMKLVAFKNNHISNKYSIDRIKKEVFNSASFLFSDEAKNVLITSDINSLEDLQSIENVAIDIMILDSSHVDLSQIQNVKIFRNAKTVFLSHYDESNRKKLQQFAIKIKKQYKMNICMSKEKSNIVI